MSRSLEITVDFPKDETEAEKKRRSNPGYQIPEDDLGRRRNTGNGHGGGPGTGGVNAPVPTISIDHFRLNFDGYYAAIQAFLHITAGTSSTIGAQLSLRQIQQNRFADWDHVLGTYPQGIDSTFVINPTNFSSSYDWVVQRFVTFEEDQAYRNVVPTPPEPGLISHVRIRDYWTKGGFVNWSLWVEITINYPPQPH